MLKIKCKLIIILVWACISIPCFSACNSDESDKNTNGGMEPRVSETSLLFLKNGGTQCISIVSDEQPLIQSDQDWCKAETAPYTHYYNFNVTVTPNSKEGDRSAILTVTGGKSSKRIEITVTQEGDNTNIKPLEINITDADGPKMTTGENNPLLDFRFCADPTSVVHKGRIYVYGSNDHAGYENNVEEYYGYMKSIVVMSSADMVNWTYHGVIDVPRIATWAGCAWAPSATKKVMGDGSTRFFLYFGDGASATGVLTADSPLGPWTDPLGKALITPQTPTLGHCPCPFDPGVVVDESGQGWLSFGGGGSSDYGSDLYPGVARIVKLGDDMISLASDIAEIPAPYFNEASELNYINGTWVYTYCNTWVERTEWPYTDYPKPSGCTMAYMTSKTPLEKDSWEYKGEYLKNPGEMVGGYSNNHTHFEYFKGKYYLFYHSIYLRDYFQTHTYRNIAAQVLDVDEATITIGNCRADRQGVTEQIEWVDASAINQAECVAATYKADFQPIDQVGNMLAQSFDGQNGCLLVRGVKFDGENNIVAKIKGTGQIDVYVDALSDSPVAKIKITGRSSWSNVSQQLISSVTGNHDVYFVIGGGDIQFDEWSFTK